jgi:arabinogalactan oligomer/maltooligosaccharide transport system permease protein
MTYIPFLTEPGWAKVMVILINVWIGIPYLMLIATGILMNIPADLMESARIDGANSFQIFVKITLPYILFVTGPYLVTQFVGNINNFNVIFLLSQDVFYTKDQMLANSQAKEIDLLVTWLYRLTQEYYNYKMASVIGIVVFIICAVFTLLAFNFLIKGDKEESFQ